MPGTAPAHETWACTPVMARWRSRLRLMYRHGEASLSDASAQPVLHVDDRCMEVSTARWKDWRYELVVSSERAGVCMRFLTESEYASFKAALLDPGRWPWEHTTPTSAVMREGPPLVAGGPLRGPPLDPPPFPPVADVPAPLPEQDQSLPAAPPAAGP